jgi:hypothetical protein
VNVHPLIQCARGALSDDDIVEAERLLGLAVDRAKDLEDENARLRLIVADLIEGETAEEGTPQWYALRNARSALGTDEQRVADGD